MGNISRIEVNERGAGGIASQITVYGDKRQIVMQNQNEIRKALCSCYGKIKLCDDTTRAGMTMLPSAFILLEKDVYKRQVLIHIPVHMELLELFQLVLEVRIWQPEWQQERHGLRYLQPLNLT